MQDVLKADIFFFITTIAVIAIGICLVIFLVYAIRIISDIKFVSKKIKEESVEFLHDAKEMRETIKEKGTSLAGIFSLIFGAKKHKKRSK